MARSRAISAFFLSGMSLLALVAACSSVNENNRIYPEETRGSLEVVETCPRPKQEDVSVDAVIKLLFNKGLDPATVRKETVLLGNGRWHVRGDIYYDDRVVTYVPVRPLDPGTKYGVYITPELRDADGFALTEDAVGFSFTTGDPGVDTCR